MFYLTVTARMKNGKRHIVAKSNDLYHLRAYASLLSEKYVVEIYNSRWVRVETLNSKERG